MMAFGMSNQGEKCGLSEWPLRMAACLVAAVLVPAVCPALGASSLTEGGRLIAAGKYRGAEEAFRKAAAGDALSAVARAGQGAALLFEGNAEAGEAAFGEALALDPNCVSALLGQGAARYCRGQVQDAMASYRQALAYNTPYRAHIRACVAQLACMCGFYRAAELESQSALNAAGDCELACQVLAASCIAQQRAPAAIKALTRPLGETATAYPGLAARSPIFAPATAYYVDAHLDENLRLALLSDLGVSPTVQAAEYVESKPQEVVVEDKRGLHIEWPKAGARVSGAIEIVVRAPEEMAIEYIALLLDSRFVGVSSSKPYRMYVDTRTCADGLRELRCEAYGRGGDIVGHSSLLVTVVNGSRTLMAEEVAARAEVDLFLQQCLLLRADPLLRSQLCGRALQMAGRTEEAVGAYEYGFSYNPQSPGLRADLLLAYHGMGIVNSRPHEIHRISGAGKCVALTFDDGPHPVLTPVILDLLDRYNAKATFMVVGKQAETYPELVRMIAERGHELGNHSYSHRNLTKLSQLEVERELVMTRQIVRRASGRFLTLFRPPGGHYDANVRKAAQLTGFTTLFWNENIGTYRGCTAEAICSAMIEKIGASNIILLHNGYDETPELLPLLLPALQSRGYRMDTVSALSAHQYFPFGETATIGPPGWQLH